MKLALPAALALSIVASVGVAQAKHMKPMAPAAPAEAAFYATPMNAGAPENLPGESIIPGMSLAMHTVNMVTQPILQPILAPDGGAPMPADAPMGHHHMMMHHHHMMMHHHGEMMMHHHHMMMHHKAMMHKSM